MLKSMTGYGQAVKETSSFIARAEIKSVNSRGLDLTIRVPKGFSEKEITLRGALNPVLQRGKVTVWIEFEYLSNRLARKTINQELFKAYYSELRELAASTGAEDENLFPLVLQMPEVMQADGAEPGPEDWAVGEQVMQEALRLYDEFRAAEGASLGKELTGYIRSITASLDSIDGMKEDRLIKVRTEMREKMKELLNGYKADENRLEEELVYYAEKFDITEEIVRLRTHLQYFLDTMHDDSPGKKMGFISQEMGREINTIGSKANDAGIQKYVVLMKEELEKIKEQLLNVL